MRRGLTQVSCLFVLGLAAYSHCLAQSAALNLSSASGTPGTAVVLNISSNATGNLPAAIEWTFNYSTTDFSSASVAPGPAAANKSVSCNTSAPGTTTCLVWGLNNSTIPNGIVAAITLMLASSTTSTSSTVQLANGLGADPTGQSLTTSTTGGTVTIVQTPKLSGFSCNPLSISPSAGSTCTVNLTSPALSGGASIALSSSPAGANVPSSVTIPQGSALATFSVTAGSVSSATVVTLTASYSGLSSTFPITVNPPAVALNGVSVNPSAVVSGQSATGTVTLTAAAGSGGVPVALSSSNAAAASVPSSVTVPQGASSATFSVNTGNVSSATSVTLTASYSGLSKTFGLTVNPSSVPPGQPDLAQNKMATQSSTYSPGTDASKALDGNTDGLYGDGSLSITNLDGNPWWQVDLGASATVSSIVVWNRTDCCGNRLSDYWVFVSDTPFGPTDTPATLQNRAGTFSSHQTVQPNPSATITIPGAQGRYVRVQLSGANYLTLAEVQVFGTLAGPVAQNIAVNKTATQSSAYSLGSNASKAVDGNTDGLYGDGSLSITNLDGNPWWQVDLGASATVSSIVVWNRTDCCGDRLSDYWVFVSGTPFGPTDTPATLQNRAGTFSSHQTVQPNPSATITIPGAQGRYVRVQLSGANYLTLAEVQVFGQ